MLSALALSAHAQSAGRVEVGGHLSVVDWGEVDATDTGIGGRVAWYPMTGVGVEAELTLYPSDVPDDPAISRRRFEGLFGITAGPTLGRLRPFARLRPGFVRVSEAPGPVACILIFPPPLTCLLAAGHTLPAIDFGGGLDVALSPRTFARVDVGDRMLRYPGPSISGGESREGKFWGHDLRVTVGGGFRF